MRKVNALYRLIPVVVVLLLSLFLVSCDTEDDYTGMAKITFYLEGGTYKNITQPIVQYYDIDDDKDTGNLILDPSVLSNSPVERSGYTFDGWYTKDNKKWEFTTDYLTDKELELYAKWKKNVEYKYAVCYINSENKEVLLGEYVVDEGKAFSDYDNYAKKNIGYTCIGYTDTEGNPWNSEFVHPGGEENLTIKVYASYIEGTFAVVKTVRELKANKSKNIYLTSDLDFEGSAFNFGDYKGIFLGNGHTISNISINYSAAKNDLQKDFENPDKSSLCISLFGNATNAVIKDVTFENVSIDVKTLLSSTYHIYLSPLCMKITECEITNVKVTGTYNVVSLPDSFDINESLIISDKEYYIKDELSQITNCEVSLEKK